jgi:DNA ligase (NAD+)
MTTVETATARIEELEIEIKRHSDLYYNGMPEITDAEFDILVDELTELSPESPVLADVGAIPAWGRKVKHPSIMGSLSKETTVGGLHKWHATLELGDGVDQSNNIVASPKVDGLAVRLRYVKGKLVEAATRGDGEIGQDILENAKQVRSIPQEVSETFTGEVRGEVYMRKDVWKGFGSQFANPRNGASGGLLQKDASVTGERCLDFMAYSAIIEGDYDSDRDELSIWTEVAQLGFNYVKQEIVDMTKLDEYLQEWKDTRRDNLPYQIDGLVFSANSYKTQEEAGWNGKRPRGKIAWKFPAEQKEAMSLGVTWQVGRTGKLTPVLHIEPTHLDGSTISNISLASKARFDELSLGRGDKVLIEKGGDIIPQVVRVTWRPLRNDKFKAPENCPVCDSDVEEDGAHVFCRKDACPTRLSRRILHWLRVVDVKGAGPSIVNAVCSDGLVSKVSDLYYLDSANLTRVIGSQKIADNILNELAKKSSMPFWKFLSGLSISSLGKTASKAITKHYVTIDEIIDADVEGLKTIDGIGDITAEQIIDGLVSMAIEVDELQKALDIEAPVVGGKLSGLSFCITGKMSRDRKLIAADIEAAGGDVKSSVGKGLTYLVQADPTSKSSKTQKAEKLGTEVISEERLMEILNA